jgi:DNA-binding response OmpR family regulator
MLPGKDGLGVLQELKANDETRLIPVIVVSGKESNEQVHQAMMAGAIDYVIKPFEPMELGMRIQTFLDTLNTEIAPDTGGML